VACTCRLERAVLRRGFRLVAGVDEAGRGCLFGPVFAAAVILDLARPIRGLNDSKQIPPAERERLAVLIRERAVAWAIASVEPEVIDRINILQASRLAMRLAVEQLQPQADFLLVDAVSIDLTLEQQPVIHGDALSRSIAAASILAKVDRDACMDRWEDVYPGYGFARHRGYSTPEHISALDRLGPTPHHRFSYEPVRIAAGLEPRQLELFDA
jgi:ribonuclease HII